jgi:NitT/TauT family transport system substrate-binding protein
MKKLLISVAVLIIGGVLYWQYSGKQAPESSLKPTGQLMKISKYYWPGEFWIEIADAKGWFKEAGLNVKIIDTNKDYYQSLQDMAEGKLDVNTFPLFGLMEFRNKGSDLVLVLNSDISWGAEAIVAKRSIKDIKGLKGKTVAVKQGDYTEYILDIVLNSHGLTMNDIRPIDISTEKAPQAFIEGNVDAYIAWEPLASEGIKNGEGVKLFDTSQIPGILPAGICFHRTFIQKRSQDVQAFVNVWHKTTEYIKTNPKEALGIIAKNYKVSLGEVQAFMQVDKILDLKDNIASYSFGSGFDSLHGAAKNIHTYMIKKRLSAEKILDSKFFLNNKFIRNLDKALRRK